MQAGSAADGVVQRGDLVRKISDYDSRDIRHQDVQTLFKNAGPAIKLVVSRCVLTACFTQFVSLYHMYKHRESIDSDRTIINFENSLEISVLESLEPQKITLASKLLNHVFWIKINRDFKFEKSTPILLKSSANNSF